MSEEFCASAEDMVEKAEHEDCECKTCSHCSEPLGQGIILDAYSNVFLHVKCVFPFLTDNGSYRFTRKDGRIEVDYAAWT